MKRIVLMIVCMTAGATVSSGTCSLDGDLSLPVRLKAEGKPKVAKWGKVNKTLAAVAEALAGRDCELQFGDIFAPVRQDIYFPAISNLIRAVPEESLKGAGVYSQDGYLLGNFANTVTFEKKGQYTYNTYYFQFTDRDGELQSTGNQLIDMASGKPNFLFKWDDIRERILISVNSESSDGS